MKNLPQLKPYLTHPFTGILIGILCCLGSYTYYSLSLKNLDSLEEKALYLQEKKKWAEWKQQKEEKLAEQLKKADSDYVEKQLESLVFLEPEIQKLQALLHSEPQNALYNKRLQFLQNGQNALRFKEQNFQRNKNFQERELVQQHSVEMNQYDLKKLLARIENVTIGNFTPGPRPPFFIVKSFDLLKKTLTSTEESYVVQLELIKKEMHHE